MNIKTILVTWSSGLIGGEVIELFTNRGYSNSISLIESIKKIELIIQKKMIYKYSDTLRIGDHICYYSNFDKIKKDFPNWTLIKNLDAIFMEVFHALSI